ncbi:MAG: gamma-glutamyl-gamma-aminobutyrate hydrolase family protein [Acidobacteria bacterium]|nr:gamma-glutamyl-gamma-aminobutyrate hydrolase family protein [Acidobacteriota bacterium]
MTYKPRIGLTMRVELATRRFYLGRDYSEAVEAAGGLPVHVPLIPRTDFIESVVSHLDGVLLPGADCDVDPSFYGEEPHPKLKTVVPEKDQTDRLVLAAAERRNLPVLAICYGMQALNVFRGGTLIQDIEAQVENSIKHEQGMPLDRNSHGAVFTANSILSKIAATENFTNEVKVNSHHHQAIRKVGHDLEVIARANDGVIEGIQGNRSDQFVLGVQWHPELSWTWDAISAGIFREFVNACSVYSCDARNEKMFAELVT